jgi:hypothetical protein
MDLKDNRVPTKMIDPNIKQTASLLPGEEEIFLLFQRKHLSQALVAHACNPSYSGDSDQEDHSSKPALGK